MNRRTFISIGSLLLFSRYSLAKAFRTFYSSKNQTAIIGVGSAGVSVLKNPKLQIKSLVAYDKDVAMKNIQALNKYKQVVLVSGLASISSNAYCLDMIQRLKNQGFAVSWFCFQPFSFEGKSKQEIALETIKQAKDMKVQFRPLDLNSLQKYYGNMTIKKALQKADDLLVNQICYMVKKV